MSLFNKIFGSYSDREVKRILPLVNKIDSLKDNYSNLSDEKLKDKTIEFKERLSNGETLDDILPEAFATVREASKRVLGMEHYREQLIGGIVLHQGRISEMKTGEGKTLVATLPAYLNALSGKGVHIITVNDYLATRDAEEMGKVYCFLGLSTGVVIHSKTVSDRRDSYNCDITYGTNNEFGFDYLRDNMVMYTDEKVQRELNYCIVDEVDSILIDEARTPLIISGAGDKSTEMYGIADTFVKRLKEETDYKIDEKGHAVMLTEEGMHKAERVFNIDNYADLEHLSLQHYITQALKANFFMGLDKDYMIKNEEVIIVDEFTGRLMEGRRYSDGLHQAIEAKEGVKIQRESKTLATITFQNYFRMYNKLSGMTGTALTEEAEFREIYCLDVIAIPTHKPIARKDHSDLVFLSTRGKHNAIIKDIIETNKKGQPVLVGTTSIEKSEILSNLLKVRNINHQVLNAKHHDVEAEIISKAGDYGNITIATNMAGRGTDIKLSPEALNAGGLKIIGTERHESRRIDNQLRGRSGRQGDVGESRFYISLEDDLMRIFGSEKMAGIVEKLGLTEDDAIENAMVTKSIENAQKKVEGAHFDSRKHVLGYDDVMNQQRTLIYNQRNRVLNGEDVKNQILGMTDDIIEFAVNTHLSEDSLDEEYEKELEDILLFLENAFMPTGILLVENFTIKDNDELCDYIKGLARAKYNEIESSVEPDVMRNIERALLLRCVDARWMDHIDNMDHFKQGIGLRAYKQIDPLQAYQMEGSEMFEEMIDGLKYDVVKNIFKINTEPSIDTVHPGNDITIIN